MKHSESIQELVQALAKARKTFKPVKKTSENPYFKSKYADLNEVVDATFEALSDNGLVVIQAPDYRAISVEIGKEFFLVYVSTLLAHQSGQWVEFDTPMIVNKQDAQGLGSAITYARRYAYQAVLNVAAEADDDANSAVGDQNFVKTPKRVETKAPPMAKQQKLQPLPAVPAEEKTTGPGRISVAQIGRMFTIAKAHGWAQSEIRELMGSHGFEHSHEITTAAYDKIISDLEARPMEVVEKKE